MTLGVILAVIAGVAMQEGMVVLATTCWIMAVSLLSRR